MLRRAAGLAAAWIGALAIMAGPAAAAGHYMFAWAGDADGKGEDFLMVVDADPGSPTYGHLVTTAASGVRTQQVHHTEYWAPAGGLLFANDHMAGQTVVMDIRDPLHPQVHAKFGDLGGFSHPHSFLRLPNGHVLASFQVEGHMDHMEHGAAGHVMDMSGMGIGDDIHGGIVEIDDEGHLVRAASTADPAHRTDFLMAYSLLPLPDIDRVLVTNSAMRPADRNGSTYQIFRLSDLKLLSTNALDASAGRYGELNPEEARRGPDGSVYVHTLGCGVERITDIATAHPKAKLVYQYPGSNCGVPTIVSHYMIQTVPILHGAVVLDIAQPDHPVEVSRVALDPAFEPHWTAYDPVAHRLVVTGYNVERMWMLKFDEATGALSVDTAFHDDQGKPGFDLSSRAWPHGWTGPAHAHGVVFSR